MLPGAAAVEGVGVSSAAGLAVVFLAVGLAAGFSAAGVFFTAAGLVAGFAAVLADAFLTAGAFAAGFSAAFFSVAFTAGLAAAFLATGFAAGFSATFFTAGFAAAFFSAGALAAGFATAALTAGLATAFLASALAAGFFTSALTAGLAAALAAGFFTSALVAGFSAAFLTAGFLAAGFAAAAGFFALVAIANSFFRCHGKFPTRALQKCDPHKGSFNGRICNALFESGKGTRPGSRPLAESWSDAGMSRRSRPTGRVQKKTDLLLAMTEEFSGAVVSSKPGRNMERNEATRFSDTGNPQKSTMFCFWRLSSVETSAGRLA